MAADTRRPPPPPPARIQAGATVRYLEPASGKLRIGTVERTLSRGPRKGYVVVRAAAADARRSTVRPDQPYLKELNQ